MAKTFSFEEALKPASQSEPRTFSFEEALKPAQQQGPRTFSFEEALQAPANPAVTSGPNPLDPQQPAPVQAAQPAQPDLLKEAKEAHDNSQFTKGIKSATLGLGSTWENIKAHFAATGMESGQAALSLFDAIDAGKVKNKSDLSKILHPEGMLKEMEDITKFSQSQAAVNSNAYSAAKDYLSATPEERTKIRAELTADVNKGRQQVASSMLETERIKKEQEPYKGRVEKLFDIRTGEGVGNFLSDAGDYLAYTSGSSIPQMAPTIGSALVLRRPGAITTGAGMELGSGTQQRIEYITEKLGKETDPDKRVDAAIKYVQESKDLTVAAAVVNGAFDAFLGPENDVVKAMAANTLRQETRKIIAKETPKAILKSAGQEGLTGGMQEIVNMIAERQLGELSGDLLTVENIKRVVEGAAAEAVGGGTMSTGIQASKLLLAKKNLADTDTPEGRAMRGLDDLAAREEAGTTEEMIVPPTEGELVPGSNVTEVEAKNILENLTTQLGREPTDQEFEDAYDDYISQRTGTGAGTSGASTADTSGAPSDTGAGVPPSSEGTGLGVPDTTTTGTGISETDESSTLETPTGEQRNVATYLDGLPQDIKRYETYLGHETVGPILQYADATIQRLTSFINERGFTVNEVNGANPDSAAKEAKSLSSQLAGSVSRLLTKQDGVDRNLKRANPEQLEKSKVEVDTLLNEIDAFINKQSVSPQPTEVIKPNTLETARTAYIAAEDALSKAKADLDAARSIIDNIGYGGTEEGKTTAYSNLNDAETKYEEAKGNAEAAFQGFQDLSKSRSNRPQANVAFTGAGSSYAYKDPIAALVDSLPLNQFGVNKLQKMLEDNKLSYAEYTNAMTYLQGRMRHVRDLKSATDSGLAKERGYERVIKALKDAADQGKISPEAYKMVRWFLSKNFDIAKDLAISIGQPKKAYRRNQVENGLLGVYSPVQRLVEIFLRFNPNAGLASAYNNDDVDTAIHEILHHLERLMPKELQAALRNEWAVRVGDANRKADQALRRINAQVKKQEGILKNPARAKEHEKARADLARLDKEGTKQRNILTYLEHVNEYNANNNNDAAELAKKMITRGDVPYTMYALFDPSEFWAVIGSDIIAGRYGVSSQNKFKKIAQFLKEFIEYVKDAFGMPSDAPLLRGLKAILEGDGKYLSREQLATGNIAALPNIKGWEQADTSVSDAELKALEGAMTGGDMNPTVVSAIANNDIKGALNAISKMVGGFYGALAARLAELDLPTNTRIGDQRNMTRKAIDLRSTEAQKTLFEFIRTMMPDVYAKYFENYDRPESLERVYEGLKAIQNNPKLAPAKPQLESVLEAFDGSMKGLTAHGGYYPSFDVINLNPTTNQGLSYRVFLHEAVHAATVMLLNTPADQRTAEQNEAIAELEKLFEAAKASTNIPYYGFTNLKEFISEIYTNKEFQADLRKVPYAPARTNILSRFVKLVMDMFGMDNITSRSIIEANKLFNADRSVEPVSAGPVFSARKRGPISSRWRIVEDTMRSVKDWEVIKNDLIPAMWDATNGVFRGAMLGVMNLRQIADVTKTKFPQIDAAIRTIEKMIAYRGKIMNEGGDIIQRWTKAQAKNLRGSQLLGRVMLEATIRGIEVDPQSKEHNVLKINKELADAWDVLGSDFQQVYRDVRDFYKRAVEETVRLMKERANKVTDPVERQELIDKIDAQFGPDKLKGPYFPLRRFGEFWFQVGEGNFKEFYMYESRIARTIAMRVRKRELSKGNAQQRALAETMNKGNGMSTLYGQNVGTTKILQDVQDIVDSIGGSVVDSATGLPRDKTQDELKGEIRDSLNQLIYILLPQQSMRKMFINRKAIQGASGDMLRVFATHAVHSAYQRSRFKYAQDFMDNLSNAQEWINSFAKGDKAEVYRDYVNEVEKRSKTILGTEDTSLVARVAGKASEAVFYFMLSAPFTAMLNLVGFAQIAMPYIGGRFGYAKTNARILENMGKYLQTVPKRTFSPLAKGAVMDMAFPSIVEGGKLTGILKDAAQQLLDEEQINISLTNDVLNVGSGPTAEYTGTYNAVKRGISALFHQSERLNREITLLSVVELAYEKLMSEPIKDAKGIIKRDAQGQPMRYTDNATTSDGTTQYSQEALELAINEAKDIAGLSLGDFTRQMKPRYFTPPLLSVLTKFKQYSVLASYAVIRNAQLGLLKPFSKAELDELRTMLEEHYKTAVDKDQIIEQQMAEAQTRQKEIAKEARRRLAGILGMTYLFGGYVALPFFSTVTPILVGMLAGDEDDEDEFFNWENWFKNYMETEFGGYTGALLQKFGVDQEKANKAGKKISEALVYGPASTVTGGALSDRVSLDLKNLWYRDGRYSPDTRESVVESIIANAGPVVGLTVNAADAWDLMKDGKVGRAFERMAPALFAKPATAARLATEGAKTKGGDTLVDELTTTEIALQAIGLQPLRVAKAQKASIETVEKVQKIQDQYNSLMNRLWMERNNSQEFNDALEELYKFAMKHPGYKVDGDTIKNSFKKRTEDAALAEVFGARIPKQLQSDPTVVNMPKYGRD